MPGAESARRRLRITKEWQYMSPETALLREITQLLSMISVVAE